MAPLDHQIRYRIQIKNIHFLHNNHQSAQAYLQNNMIELNSLVYQLIYEEKTYETSHISTLYFMKY